MAAQLDIVAQRAVGLVEETVLTYFGADPIGKVLLVENLDVANTLTYHFESSPDGATFTDITTPATLAPGASIAFLLTDASPFLRMRGEGNLNLSLITMRSKAFNGNFTLVTI